MDVEIRMPDLSTTGDEVTLIRWMVEVGQAVGLGQPLLEIETDKASMEVESVAAGILKAVYAEAGNPVAIGQVIAVIEKPGDKSAANLPPMAASAASGAVASTARATETPPAPMPPGHNAKPANSMFARNKLARESKPVGESQDIVLNATQRELARRLQDSKLTIPHYYLNTSANAERLVAARKAAHTRNPTQKILWDAYFVLAAARALSAFDRMNYRFDKDRLVRRTTEAIGVAADIDGDLYVLAIDAPSAQTPEQISAQIVSRLAQIREGNPAAKKLQETGITITNLGSEGIESFMAIINPPESAVLAIGKIAPTVQADGGQIVVQQRVSLSLSVDHRIANGKYAAAFLGRIVKELESF